MKLCTCKIYLPKTKPFIYYQIENNVKSLFPNYDYHVCTKIIKKYVDEEYDDYGCKYRVFKAFMYCLSDAFETIYGPTKKA